MLGAVSLISVPEAQAEPSKATNAFSTRETGAPEPPPWVTRPECGTIAYYGEAWEAVGDAISEVVAAIGATLIPQTGVRWESARAEGVMGALSWPASIPFGRPTARSIKRYHCGPPTVGTLRAHRIVIEPGLTFGARPTGFGRLGYRGVWHPSSSTWGVGAGIGSTIEIFAPGTTLPRPSLSPELLVHFGECCTPGYVVGIVRYDRFFAGARDAFTISLGLAFF